MKKWFLVIPPLFWAGLRDLLILEYLLLNLQIMKKTCENADDVLRKLKRPTSTVCMQGFWTKPVYPGYQAEATGLAWTSHCECEPSGDAIWTRIEKLSWPPKMKCWTQGLSLLSRSPWTCWSLSYYTRETKHHHCVLFEFLICHQMNTLK